MEELETWVNIAKKYSFTKHLIGTHYVYESVLYARLQLNNTQLLPPQSRVGSTNDTTVQYGVTSATTGDMQWEMQEYRGEKSLIRLQSQIRFSTGSDALK